MEQKKRKVYSREFKLEAVRLSLQDGHSVLQTARDLGVSPDSLFHWRRQFKTDQAQAFPGQGRLKPEQEELRRLRRENQQLRQERDFLKKAAVWLAQEAHPGTS